MQDDQPSERWAIRLPRYFFTNHSTDILEIFKQACDAAEIAHTQSNDDTISIARRRAVAALDAFIGPKS